MTIAQTRPAARGCAAFFGLFSLLNVLGELRHRGFDATIWWVDLRPLPSSCAALLTAAAGGTLLSLAIRPAPTGRRRGASAAIVGLLIGATLANAAQFYVLLARRLVRTPVPIPLSLVIAAALAWCAACLFGRGRVVEPHWPRRRAAGAITAFCVTALLFPLAQMCAFGLTDYRRPADAIVVFGARTHADGRPSDALADRVQTAVDLYDAGLAPRLIFSGGPGDGSVTEPQAMKAMAMRMGVPPTAIELDADGLNTAATVADTTSGSLAPHDGGSSRSATSTTCRG